MTNSESMLYRKSKGQIATLNYLGHVLMENWNGLAVGFNATTAGYFAEHEASLPILEDLGTKERKP